MQHATINNPTLTWCSIAMWLETAGSLAMWCWHWYDPSYVSWVIHHPHNDRHHLHLAATASEDLGFQTSLVQQQLWSGYHMSDMPHQTNMYWRSPLSSTYSHNMCYHLLSIYFKHIWLSNKVLKVRMFSVPSPGLTQWLTQSDHGTSSSLTWVYNFRSWWWRHIHHHHRIFIVSGNICKMWLSQYICDSIFMSRKCYRSGFINLCLYLFYISTSFHLRPQPIWYLK